ncbi:hypothetical protein [Kitasatospora indigofera]|uniref:hypothetical protein n=1 Tax=Kitasatospora indigofera TaxID=67307 RepID=UPI00367FBEF9
MSQELIQLWTGAGESCWELDGDVKDRHPAFDHEDQERDELLAMAWANRTTGRRLAWRRDERPEDAVLLFAAVDTDG